MSKQKKKDLILNAAGHLNNLGNMAGDIFAVLEIYKQSLTAVNPASSPTAWLEDILQKVDLLVGSETAIKIIQGATLGVIKSTVDPDTYERICKTRFKISTQTGDKRAEVYEAWFSGNFLYNLPDGCNPFDLSFRDLETGASLIIEGELDEERVLYLFSDDNGNWAEKREVLRDMAPSVVKRQRRKVKKPKKPTIDINNHTGKIVLNYPTKGKESKVLGHLDVSSNDPATRVIVKELIRAVRIHFRKRGVHGETV